MSSQQGGDRTLKWSRAGATDADASDADAAGHASVGWFERVLGCVKYSTWCACGRAGGHGRGRAPPCGRLRALEASNGFADASTRDGSTPSSSPVFALLL